MASVVFWVIAGVSSRSFQGVLGGCLCVPMLSGCQGVAKQFLWCSDWLLGNFFVVSRMFWVVDC